MHTSVILRVLGVLLMTYSLSMIPPALVALFYDDGGQIPFLYGFAITLGAGLLCFLPVYNKKQELRTRDGFIIVVMFWTVLGLVGSIPLLLSEQLSLSFTDAAFESISGLTTTGATILTQIDDLPKSVLYYRQQLQWLGGMGIIVLAVAILPMLGIGGMQLYRAETPGPVKDSKLTPRITETAKTLWYIYVSLTILCAAAYWLSGMDTFDAICHAFSTIAIGGFSTHDDSIGHFDSPLIEGVTIFFMLAASFNFALHFVAWRNKSIFTYWQDPELRFFLTMILAMVCVAIGVLYLFGTYDSFLDAVRFGAFETISVATTTGYGVADFASWPPVVPTTLILGSFMGACAGSTGGGIKVIRVLLMFKQGVREIRRLIHPNAVFVIKLGNKPVQDRVIEAVWGFVGVYITIYSFLFLAVLATGMDFVTGFSAVAASINNLGPGLGNVSAHYQNIPSASKWIMCFAMLLGRLEVFTLLVIFNPMFWRR